MTDVTRLGTGGGRWGMRADVLRHGAGHDSSRVGYVELFFDLVFVFAVTQLSHMLIHHTDGRTLVQTIVLGWAVWWLWIDTTWVTNWLDPDKVPVRTMLLVLMLLGLLMSSAIPEAFGDKALLFAVPFVLIQLGRTLFTVWAMGRHWPENAVNFQRITVWLAVSGGFWIAGALVDGNERLALWVVAALIDVAGPRALFWVPFLGPTDPSTWEVRGDAHGRAGVAVPDHQPGRVDHRHRERVRRGRGLGHDGARVPRRVRQHGAHVAAVLRPLRAPRDRVLRRAGEPRDGRADRLHVRALPADRRHRAHRGRRRARPARPARHEGTPTRGPRASSAERPPSTCWATRCSDERRAAAGP